MGRKDIPKKKKQSSFQREEDRPLKPIKKDNMKYKKPQSWMDDEDELDDVDFLFFGDEEE